MTKRIIRALPLRDLLDAFENAVVAAVHSANRVGERGSVMAQKDIDLIRQEIENRIN